MRYIEIPDGTPAFHLACEQAIFQSEPRDDILLLWKNSPVIVCGAYQNIFQETDVYRAKADGIEILRRISGGGTVYHDEGNLNFSLIMDAERFQDYDDLLLPVILAMRSAGIPAEKGGICDIRVGGIKVSGNAQKIAKGRILQHGTLLYDADLNVLRRVSGGVKRVYESKATRSVPAEVGNIKDICDCGTIDDFRDALISNFPEKLEREEMSSERLEEASRLVEERYSKWAWNYGKSPKFRCRAEGSVGGSNLAASFFVRKGVIEEMSLTGEGVPEDADSAFIGVRMEEGALRAAAGTFAEPEAVVELLL